MEGIVAIDDPKSPAADAYRCICTSIQFANIDLTVKTIVVTSSKQDEGKTTVAANIAVSLALQGRRVAVIDCDFRKPSLHKSFELSNKKGVTDILLVHAEEEYDSYIRKILSSDIDIITSGQVPANPTELIGSNSMKLLLDSIRKNYDYVIIDTPPVGIVPDAGIISTYADGVIIVCSSGDVEIELARRAKKNLERAGANIIGLVLNNYRGTIHSSCSYCEEG